jgi:hypothetical protein
MAAKGAAGYVNAAGRTRYPVPVPSMRDLVWRAPDGGSWDTKLARQKELAAEEQGEETRAQSAQQVWAQEQERLARAKQMEDMTQVNRDWRLSQAKIAEQTEEDRRYKIIKDAGGRGSLSPDVVHVAPGAPLPEGKGWNVYDDPYTPGGKVVVRPNQGIPLTQEKAQAMQIPWQGEGQTYAPAAMVSAFDKLQSAQTIADQRYYQRELDRARQENESLRKGKEFEETRQDRKLTRDILQQNVSEKTTEAKQKVSDAADRQREGELTAATTWRQNEVDKAMREEGAVDPASLNPATQAKLNKEWQRRSQSAYDRWSGGIRRRGGSAADFTVDPGGGVVPSTEPYGLGAAPVPLGATPASAAPTAPPAQSTGGGRGGRGGGNLPARVNVGGPGVTETATHPPSPPPDSTFVHGPGTYTLDNGQIWRKNRVGPPTYMGNQ